MPKKLTIEHARQEFEKVGLELLEDNYIGTNNLMKTRCSVGHIFYIRLRKVKEGQGCRKCANKEISERLRMSDAEIRNRVKEKHGKSIIFLGIAKRKFGRRHGRFKCVGCKHIWEAAISSVTSHGTTCPKCAGRMMLSKKIVNERLRKNKRDVRMVGEYVSSRKNSFFNCLVCDNKWLATPVNVVNNETDCPSCSVTGFKINKSAILYYLRIDHRNKIYYKVGVTNRTVQERFCSSELEKITILKTWNHKKGKTSLKKEQITLKKYSKYRYAGRAKILKSGTTEIFTKDVLNLNKCNSKHETF